MADEIANLVDGDLIVGFSHDGAMAEAGFDKTAIGQGNNRLSNCGSAHSIPLHKVTLGGETLAFLKASRLDHAHQFGCHGVGPTSPCTHCHVAMQLFALVHGHPDLFIQLLVFLGTSPSWSAGRQQIPYGLTKIYCLSVLLPIIRED
jgi:hypothetical protein